MLVTLVSMLVAAGPGPEVREFLGDDALGVLQYFHEMQILVLEAPLPGEHDARAGHERIRVKAQRTVAIEDATLLAAIFLRDRTYRFDRSKSCNFIPKSGLRLTNGFHRLDLLFSFECATFRMVLFDDQGQMLLRKEEDFDRSKRRLRRLLRRALRTRAHPSVVAAKE